MKRKYALNFFTALLLMLCMPLFHVFQVVAISQQRAIVAEFISSGASPIESTENLFVLKSEYPKISQGDEIWVNNLKYDVLTVVEEAQGFRLTAKADTLEQVLDELGERKQSQAGRNSGENSVSHLPDWAVLDYFVLETPLLMCDTLKGVVNAVIPKPFFGSIFLPPEAIAIA